MPVAPAVPHWPWLRQNWSGRCPPQQEVSGPGGTTHLQFLHTLTHYHQQQLPCLPYAGRPEGSIGFTSKLIQ